MRATVPGHRGLRRARRRQGRLRGVRRTGATATVVFAPIDPIVARRGSGRRRCPTWPASRGSSPSTRAATAAPTGPPTRRRTPTTTSRRRPARRAWTSSASSGRCWSAICVELLARRCWLARRAPGPGRRASSRSPPGRRTSPPGRPGGRRASFDDALDTDEGWAKYNKHYWRRDCRGFARVLLRRDAAGAALDQAVRGRGRLGAARRRRDDASPTATAPLSARTGAGDRGGARAGALPGAGHPRRPTTRCQPIGRQRPRRRAHRRRGWSRSRAPATCRTARDPVVVNHADRATSSTQVTPPPPPSGRRAAWRTRGRRPRGRSTCPRRSGWATPGATSPSPRRCASCAPTSQIDWLDPAPGHRAARARRRARAPGVGVAGQRVRPHRGASAASTTCTPSRRSAGWTRSWSTTSWSSTTSSSDEPYDLVDRRRGLGRRPLPAREPRARSASPFAWLTDFVGWLPMPDGGDREAALTARLQRRDGRARRPLPAAARPRRSSSATPTTSSPSRLGPGPADHPRVDRGALRLRRLRHRVRADRAADGRGACAPSSATADDEQVCIVTVGGSGVGRRPAAPGPRRRYPQARQQVPGLRMVVVTGPRIDPAVADAPPPDGLELHGYVARPVPAPGRVRPRRRAGRPHHDDGAGRRPAPVPLRAAAAPLRAEVPRAPPAGPLPRGPARRLRRDRARARWPHLIASEIGRPVDYLPVHGGGQRLAAARLSELL